MLRRLSLRIFIYLLSITVLFSFGRTYYAQIAWWNDWVSRYEFSDILQQAQCRDCLVPTSEATSLYTNDRLDKQKNDPQKAIDDISFENALWQDNDYYYCVAWVVDEGIMNGFPRSTSPFCPGKFCWNSFLTVVELVESLVRLVWPKIRQTYPIDRKQVGAWAKDSPSVTFIQRNRIAQAIRRCPDWRCKAENTDEFDLRLRRCTLDLERCDFEPYKSFTKSLPRTPKINVLLDAWIIGQNTVLWAPYDLVTHQVIDDVFVNVKKILSCSTPWDDYDYDWTPNRQDVCPYVYDHQRDLDSDGKGDVCDDDIDGDGIKNELWAVDANGVIIPRLALMSKDNCIIVKNTDQKNTDTNALWNVCDPETTWFISIFAALQVDADIYKGVAPLFVRFTQKNIWLTWPLQRDFWDGLIKSVEETTHLFSQAWIYFVQVTAATANSNLVSIVPIEVLPDIQIQAWLEALSKDLVTLPNVPIALQHVWIGDIEKITVRAPWVDETIDLKQSISITLPSVWKQHIELQAYNSAGQRVALSQFSIDTAKQIWSQMHASSLDPLVWVEVTLTTLLWWFNEDEVYQVSWDFGDKKSDTSWLLVVAHIWDTPGVYLVKQSIQFRDRTRSDHENILTILVRSNTEWKKLHLVTDTLQKSVGEKFSFQLETENFPVQNIRSCDWTFTQTERKRIVWPKATDLTQLFAFWAPWSYPVFVLCQSVTNQWYHVAVTVLVEAWDICLQDIKSLSCDLDKDWLPDMCDDDIDGDGLLNLMNLLTKELPNCVINAWNINQETLNTLTQACAWGASLDNCAFVPNQDQKDGDGNGIGDVCGDGSSAWGGDSSSAWWATAWNSAWWWGGDSSSAWWATAWSSAWWATAWSTSSWNGDTDGDGIWDATDACGSTPESQNGNSDSDGCPEAPADESTDSDVPDNPLIEVDTCTQCPCPEADYASALWKWDRVRAMLLDEWGTIIYKYTKPEIIQEDIPSKLLGK